MFGNPMFDLRDAAGVMMELNACRKAFPEPLHPGQRLRLDPRLRDGAAELHRQPPAGRAGFRLTRTEVRRPHRALQRHYAAGASVLTGERY
jgi:ribulose-bisphosphate carboxylase small chain